MLLYLFIYQRHTCRRDYIIRARTSSIYRARDAGG
nr:MAG TPA: hypothetical protein [Caudoviricetes sp.]